ncbi:MAG: NAD(P)/FAD-dependent oxidoreductase [Vicinamibacterales bacterium]
MRHAFDALVIGGGPAGSTVALRLARAGWSVAVVERATFPRRKVCGEFLSATNLPLLRHLGLAEPFSELAGPDVRRVAVFARDGMVVADMPRFRDGDHGWGRALGREHLDTLLLAKAAAEGVSVWQPWALVSCERVEGRQIKDQRPDAHHLCTVVCAATRQAVGIRARVVIAAHGSWESGRLQTQPSPRAARPSDLFGFKATFVDAQLPVDLMSLLTFPGGYGGMVHSDRGRVSLSCCVRRDRLDACRRLARASSAGEAVLEHMKASCSPLRDALGGAVLQDDWRSAGPIRPGVRATSREGLFLTGNAAGEAHPVVAEGISMAIQSAWLLADHLARTQSLDEVRTAYAAEWHRAFAPRIYAASLIAHWAMHPVAVRLALPLLQAFPAMLTQGARNSGKVAGVAAE